eukprot:59949_1
MNQPRHINPNKKQNEMCGTDWCKRHFHEWYKESTWCWLLVKLVLLLIVAVIYCFLSAIEPTGDFTGGWVALEPTKLLFVIGFGICIGFLTIIYTRWQHMIAPWWFKILGYLLYFGTLIFFIWQYHFLDNEDIFKLELVSNEVPFDAWTLNHFFFGIISGYMWPCLWMLIIAIGWEVIELFVYGAGDEVPLNAIIDVVVAIVGWWIVILIFTRKCIPWISARCAHETREHAKQNRDGLHRAQDEEDDYEVYGAGV